MGRAMSGPGLAAVPGSCAFPDAFRNADLRFATDRLLVAYVFGDGIGKHCDEKMKDGFC